MTKQPFQPQDNDDLPAPSPWFLTRAWRPEDDVDFRVRLEDFIREAIGNCPRCTGIFEATGLVPMSCDECHSERDRLWLAFIEELAHDTQARPAVYRIPLRVHVIREGL